MKILMAGYMPYYETEKEGILFPGEQGGGVATSVFNLAKSLVKKGNEVEVITPGFKNFIREIDGIKVVWKKEFLSNLKNSLMMKGTHKTGLAYNKYKEIFYNIFKEGEYDIYHAHNTPFLIGPTFAANECRIPSVITMHSVWPLCFTNKLSWKGEICKRCTKINFSKCVSHDGLASIIQFPFFLAIKNKSMALRKEALEKADKIVAPSKYIKDILVQSGINEEKIVIIHNIFSTSKKTQCEYHPYFCWAGRIVEEKGLKYLIRAFAEVVKKYPETKLYIIGEGKSGFLTEKRRLIRLIQQLRISKNVVFTGWISNKDVIDIISRSTAVVFPSVVPEALGMPVVEGMGCRKPIIATNRGAAPEIVEDGNNGFLVPPPDSEKLAKEMIYLLDNPNEVKRMGRNAFETVKRKCDPDIITNEHIKLYQSLIS